MAKAFCITKNIAEQFKASVRNGEWNMQTLWDMTSKQRHELFMKYVDDATALRMNAGFEQAIISEQQNALVKWAEKVFVGQDEKTKSSKRDVIDKIKELNELGYIKANINKDGNIEADDATKIFLSDLVEESLGVSISEQEMKTITEKVRVLEQYENEKDDYGLPINEYWEARRDIENYIKSLVPSKNTKVLTNLIARGSLLAGFKTAVVNISGNVSYGSLQLAEKRIARFLMGRNIYKSKATTDYMKGYSKRATQIMSKYGYDVTRIFDLKSEMKTLGEEKMTHAQGEGTIRKIGRFYEDIIFNKMLSVPDVYASSVAFADSAGLWATEIAKSEKLEGEQLDKRALELIKDSTKIRPTTLEGQKIRFLSIADANKATFQGKTRWSDAALAARKVIDTATGDLNIGTLVVPFAMTPANVTAATVEMGGGGFITGLIGLKQALVDIKKGDMASAEGSIRQVVASGLGLTLAYLLTGLFEPEDFMGAYPLNAKERQLMSEKGAMPNSIKIKGKWINLDLFGVLAAPLLGMMYARKYEGKDLVGMVGMYLTGAKVALTNFPGLEEISTITTYLSEGDEIKFDPDRFKKNIIPDIVDFLRARTIPAIVSDFAKMTDEYERDTYGDALGKIKASIPFVRQSLPIKKDVFGEPKKTEAAWSVLLFGSRLKTAKKGELLDEIVRLDNEGNAPSISNYEWSSPRVKKMKEWLSKEDYDSMIKLYQTKWIDNSLKMINSKKYQKMAADEQANELTNIKKKALEDALDEYDYDELEEKNE